MEYRAFWEIYLRYIWDIFEMCPRYSWGIPEAEISIRYTQETTEIFLKFTYMRKLYLSYILNIQDIHKIYLKYTLFIYIWHIAKIYHKYTWDISEMYPSYIWYTPEINLRFTYWMHDMMYTCDCDIITSPWFFFCMIMYA